MAKVMNLLRGTVTLTATGAFPERLINLCAQGRVPFWGLEWLDEDTIRLTTHRTCLGRLEAFSRSSGCELHREGRRGLPFFLERFRRRYAFLVGLAFALVAVCVLSRFVLVVEVEGNETIPSAVILAQLRREGLRPGVFGPGLDRGQIAQQAMTELEGLSWLSINLNGTRAQVLVREAVKPPEILQTDGFYHIKAQADGIVLHIEPEQGDAVVTEGQPVAKGDVLISGLVTIEPPKYSDQPNRYYETRARGKVWAQTWRTVPAVIPEDARVKNYTGVEKQQWALNLFGRRFNLFGSTPGGMGWEQTYLTRTLSLPGLGQLPISFQVMRSREYQCDTVPIDPEAARNLLEKRLHVRLEQLVGEDGQVLSSTFSACPAGGNIQVTMAAECREEIGEAVPAQSEPGGMEENTLKAKESWSILNEKSHDGSEED